MDARLHELLLQAIIIRLMQPITRQGVLVKDMRRTNPATPCADGVEARTLRPLQAAAEATIGA